MTRIGGFEHVHVSERESAHMSPCGWDDAAWEDCNPDATLEFLRASGTPGAPATHAEGEALRCDSGRAPTGGTNLGDMIKAAKVRYGRDIGPIVFGNATVWAAMKPGTVATVGGSMGAYMVGSHWRRWLPGFAGAHQACAFRVDSQDRVWWCDPLAPTAWSGEWMSKVDFMKFAARAIVASIVPTEEDMKLTAVVSQRWTASPDDGVLRADADRSLAPSVKLPGGTEVISYGEYIPGDGHSWRVVEWPVGSRKPMYLIRYGPGVPADHDFIAGAMVPVPGTAADCGPAVKAATDPLNAQITSLTGRITTIKAKVAAGAGDIADD
jgi:hypothetical protein